MPEGLEIDHSKPLNGTMASYSEQVLICTGKEDWKSRIHEENSGDNLAADIKELMGRGGTYSDPYRNVLITNASFESSIPPRRTEIQTTSAYVLPSFKYVPFLPRVSFDSVQALVRGYLLPKKPHPAHDNLSPIHKDRLRRNEDEGNMLPFVQDVNDVLVLICGHGGRDMRCGVLGPVLKAEFKRALGDKNVRVLEGPVIIEEGNGERKPMDGEGGEEKHTARVGVISHIGGHKFAGNVILYIPPGLKTADGQDNTLAGCGIWYGRVEPKHVEGIIQETILGGRVIENLFRADQKFSYRISHTTRLPVWKSSLQHGVGPSYARCIAQRFLDEFHEDHVPGIGNMEIRREGIFQSSFPQLVRVSGSHLWRVAGATSTIDDMQIDETFPKNASDRNACMSVLSRVSETHSMHTRIQFLVEYLARTNRQMSLRSHEQFPRRQFAVLITSVPPDLRDSWTPGIPDEESGISSWTLLECDEQTCSKAKHGKCTATCLFAAPVVIKDEARRVNRESHGLRLTLEEGVYKALVLPLDILLPYTNNIFLFYKTTQQSHPTETNPKPKQQNQFIMETIENTVDYVKDTVTGKGHEASKEANKQVAKDNNADVSTRASAATDAIGDKFNQHKDEASADVHKEAAKH
ncbi:hypothetical protein B7494_g4628 [Chlorociboria aeruginascens]|nr:hypothetical protein B7494_g4628 [Chlorociboria aeruginascens]